MADLVQPFPKSTQPFLDDNGLVATTWYQFLLALYRRTGSALGANPADAALLAAIGDSPDQGDDWSALALLGDDVTPVYDLGSLELLAALGSDSGDGGTNYIGSSYILVTGNVISAKVGTSGDVLARLGTVQTFNPPASATDVGSISFSRNANYAGGTPGFVNSAIRADTTVGAAVTAYEWAITGTVTSSAASGEHVGIYGQGTANGAAQVWAGVMEVRGNFAGGTVVGLEVSAERTAAGTAIGLDVANHGNMDYAITVPQGIPALVNAANRTCYIKFPSTGVIELNGSFYSLIGPGYQYSPIGNPLTTLGTVTVQTTAVSNVTREYLAGFHFDVSTGSGGIGNAKDKVALASTIIGNAGCGDLWALYPVQILSAGSGSYNSLICEMDLNNNVGHRGDGAGGSGLGAPVAYGLAITGDGAFRSTSAMLVSGPGTHTLWNRGLTFANGSIEQASIQDFTSSTICLDIRGVHSVGVDLSNATITNAAMVMPNGVSINSFTSGAVPMRLLYMDGVNNANVGQLAASNNIILWGSTLPGQDNSYTLGGSANRWIEVWAVNGTIQTSDLRLKQNIRDLPGDMLGLVNSIEPVRYQWKKGSDDRDHWGFIAQDIQAAMAERDLDFAGLIDDEIMGLRPDQLVPILWRAVQELSRRLK